MRLAGGAWFSFATDSTRRPSDLSRILTEGSRCFRTFGNLGSLLHFVVVVALTALVSFILYRMIEEPMIRCGKNLIRRLECDRAEG